MNLFSQEQKAAVVAQFRQISQDLPGDRELQAEVAQAIREHVGMGALENALATFLESESNFALRQAMHRLVQQGCMTLAVNRVYQAETKIAA